MFNRINQGMYWDKAWKLVEGCTPVSEGCAHCWSARETHMRENHPNGRISSHNKGLTTKAGVFNGNVRMREDNLQLPIRTKKPTVFAIWNDLFHEGVPNIFIHRAWDIMTQAKHHLFLVLTKRPAGMKAFVNGYEKRWIEYADKFALCPTPAMRNSPAAHDARRRANNPPSNLWLGVTAEDQEQADKRIPILLQVPAAKRYVSIEPMLGPVKIKQRIGSLDDGLPQVNWVICGGESGPGARPMHPDWARSLRDQCKAVGVPFLFKQWGEWAPVDGGPRRTLPPFDAKILRQDWRDGYYSERVGKTAAGSILDGKEYLEVPT